MNNSRARKLRRDADVRAEVTGDPPVIELDDAVFSPPNPPTAKRVGVMVELCPNSGVISSVNPVYEAEEIEEVVPMETYQRNLLTTMEGGAA